ncbi:MAG: FAD-binding oxidoreductase [Candidatus Eremiobacteraeota bacterium]|nr:FAD-binding oxidoreductase [Candidatus Eremiobacteraeota bacterium]
MPRNELRTLNLPIADELAKRAGSRPRVRPQECAPYAIAGNLPKLVFSPRSLSEAAKTITTVAAEGASIVIRGSGTKQWRPPHPYEVDVVLDASRCSGVVEHVPADLTVTVAAGTKFSELQEALRSCGQFFPNDPPFWSDTTVGGLISAGAGGALRQRYGTPRDNLLGMRVCLSDGSIAFTGSKVVKSVAGYDIPKLFAGAWGTLGFIGELTLKVAPLPREERGVVGLFGQCEAACRAALALAASPIFPLATTLHDRASAHRIRAFGAEVGSPWTLVIRCGGTRTAATRQSDAVAAMLRSCGASSIEALDADRLHFAWSDIAELASGSAYPGSQYVCCAIASLPSQVSVVLAAVAALFPDVQCTAHPASGVVYAHVPAGPDLLTVGQLEPLHLMCEREQLTLAYLAAPAPLGVRLRAPVPAHAPLALMRRVKATFDPSGTFDPGRFVAGI